MALTFHFCSCSSQPVGLGWANDRGFAPTAGTTCDGFAHHVGVGSAASSNPSERLNQVMWKWLSVVSLYKLGCDWSEDEALTDDISIVAHDIGIAGDLTVVIDRR